MKHVRPVQGDQFVWLGPHTTSAEESENSSVFLRPGELFVSIAPCAIRTILGSCVSVCLWDTRLHIGGANHYMLPEWKHGAAKSIRYGDLAIRSLLEEMVAAQCDRRYLAASIFGGAALFSVRENYVSSLGAMNVEFARAFLREEGIRVAGEDVGGDRGRKLVFHTGEGWSRVSPL